MIRVAAKHGLQVILAGVLLAAISYPTGRFLGIAQEAPVWCVLLWAMLLAGALTYPTLRSRWAGTQLMCAVFVAFFGVYTFSNISQVLISTSEPRSALLSAHGFLVALVFSFLLVLITGGFSQEAILAETPRLHMPAHEWLWKTALCVAAYVALYAGVRVAAGWLARAEVLPMEGVPHWQRTILETGRAFLLIAFMLPIIKMARGSRWEASMIVAVLLAVLGGIAPFILPDTGMSGYLRLAYMATAGPANLAYGFLVGYLFSRGASEV